LMAEPGPRRGPGPLVRALGRAVNSAVARFPWSWRLFSGPVRRFFDSVAVGWDTSRHTLITYESAWKRETAAELAALRWGMASLRRLSDAELDALFAALHGLNLEGEDLEALLRGDLMAAARMTGAGRSARVLLRLLQGWMRALWLR
jgi:hypothetical protein